MKLKIFTSLNSKTGLANLEKQFNDWAEENSKLDIVNVQVSTGPSQSTAYMFVFYREPR